MVASQLTKVCVDCMKNACWKIFKKTGPFVCEKRMFGPYLIKNQCALTKKAKFRDRQIDVRIGTKSREIFVSETRDTGIHIWSTHLQNAHWPKNSVNHLSVNMKSSAFSEGWPKSILSTQNSVNPVPMFKIMIILHKKVSECSKSSLRDLFNIKSKQVLLV